MTLATTRNTTILGIAIIVGALATVAKALFDGDPMTVPDWGLTFTSVMTGVGLILAKGAASTGGTVDASGKPVVDPAPPQPAP